MSHGWAVTPAGLELRLGVHLALGPSTRPAYGPGVRLTARSPCPEAPRVRHPEGHTTA